MFIERILCCAPRRDAAHKQHDRKDDRQTRSRDRVTTDDILTDVPSTHSLDSHDHISDGVAGRRSDIDREDLMFRMLDRAAVRRLGGQHVRHGDRLVLHSLYQPHPVSGLSLHKPSRQLVEKRRAAANSPADSFLLPE